MDTVLIVLIVCAAISLNTYLVRGRTELSKEVAHTKVPETDEEHVRELKLERERQEKYLNGLKKMSTMTIADQLQAIADRRK